MRLVQRDIQIPEGWIEIHCLVSMLEKLRPVVCGLTLQWSRGGGPMNPKEYHVVAVS